MAQSSFKISDNLNVDGRIVDLQGTTTSGQVLTYSSSTSTFTPSLQTPVGTVVMYGGSTVPTGWLLCDGGVYNISSYTSLGNLLLSRYGGNGTTTFAVPNFVSRIPIATTIASNPATSSTSSSDTYNHSHSATYGTDGTTVSLAHSHNSTAGPSADHNHSLNSDKGNHSHGGNTSGGGASHTHNLGYKMGNVTQATGASDSNHTHGYSTNNANHYHNNAANSANHTHGSSDATSLSHSHSHNSVTLVTANQTTSIGSHSHSTFTIMRTLFIIKT